MVSRIAFVVSSTVFFLFVIQMGGAIGQDMIGQLEHPEDFNIITGLDVDGFRPGETFNNTATTDPLFITGLTGFFKNIGTFLKLMSIDSGYFILGSVIILAYILGLVVVGLEFIRGN